MKNIIIVFSAILLISFQSCEKKFENVIVGKWLATETIEVEITEFDGRIDTVTETSDRRYNETIWKFQDGGRMLGYRISNPISDSDNTWDIRNDTLYIYFNYDG